MEILINGLKEANNFIVETFATTEMVFVAIFCVAYLMIYKSLINKIEV